MSNVNDIRNIVLLGHGSSGKTTMLSHFIEQNLEGNRYEIKHFNLREIFIVNYQHFIQTFFTLDYSKSKDDVKERPQYNLNVFKLTVDTLKGLEEKSLDPFAVMKKELQKTANQEMRPVIIIDELQALEGIYLNGQRELLKELFNFFVAMTKESHLCHVIIASSDGYFIKRIYNDSKLKKTSKFLEVDYLSKKNVQSWLNDLAGNSKIEKFTLTDPQKEQIWDMFGGSCWEISSFLGDLLRIARDGFIPDDEFEELLEQKKITMRSMFEDYAGLNEQKTGLLRAINQVNSDQSYIKLRDLAKIVTLHQDQ